MGFDFRIFDDEGLNEEFVTWLVDEQWVDSAIHFGRLWAYYHNQMHEPGSIAQAAGKYNESSRNYVQGQEYGLPGRITGMQFSGPGGLYSARPLGDIQRKEVVVENDITWRINAMVDFLFGKDVSLESRAADASRCSEIEAILKAVFDANGGVGFFQDMAVLGSVYGFVDCVVRPGCEVLSHYGSFTQSDAKVGQSPISSSNPSFESILQSASDIGLELIEAPRALPILDEDDYRRIQYYIQNFYQQKNRMDHSSTILTRLTNGKSTGAKRETVMVTEVIAADMWQRYENKVLVSEGINPLGLVPVVHIQNLAQPYYYEGISDVEQLIGLQDELNTRLSDRANRITFQSFKMYLAKGIEGIDDKPVSPGRMWCTDNVEASIDQFGGDGDSPSEKMHISEIREAMDKISGVTPVVAGVLKNKIGNLTSGVALKMTFMGMLSKTARKQFNYGRGIKQIARMILHTLDVCGVYKTSSDEREIDVVFADPLPEDTMDKLQQAQIKKELGMSVEDVVNGIGK